MWPWNAHTRLSQLLDRMRKQYSHAYPITDAQELINYTRTLDSHLPLPKHSRAPIQGDGGGGGLSKTSRAPIQERSRELCCCCAGFSNKNKCPVLQMTDISCVVGSCDLSCVVGVRDPSCVVGIYDAHCLGKTKQNCQQLPVRRDDRPILCGWDVRPILCGWDARPILYRPQPKQNTVPWHGAGL